MRKLVLLLVFLPFITTSVLAENKSLQNLDKNNLAIQGYDPVAFFSENKPIKGNPEIKSTYEGAVYLFASAENKQLFEKEPGKYRPAFGGFCAFGVSRNKLV